VTQENRLDNAAAEWSVSERFLRATDHLAVGGMFDRATAQLYYALFHAVRAVLFLEGLESKTHRGSYPNQEGRYRSLRGRADGALVAAHGLFVAAGVPNRMP
jgi:hypothetical protein